MAASKSSSRFTGSVAVDPLGPPLIGALLRMSWETVRRHMLERLHEHGFDDLDNAHLTVFQHPGPQGARPSELAARLRMSKQALNYLLGELERLGYVERRADPEDRRSKRIVLTRRGLSMGRLMRKAVREVENEWASELGPERFSQLRSLLRELNRLA